MKRHPLDFNLNDVEELVRHHGLRLDQAMRLDFPMHDYAGPDDEPVWRHQTVSAWLARWSQVLSAIRTAGERGFDRYMEIRRMSHELRKAPDA